MVRGIRIAGAAVALLVAGEAGAASWEPPAPDAKGWDWIRLESGEWLGGTLEELRDRDLQFDSDKLDLLKLDWADVVELRSPRTLTYRFEDHGTFVGTAVMRGDTVAIRTAGGVQTLPRKDLLLIIEGSQRWIDRWSAKVGVGMVGRSGNTNQSDLNATLWARRQTPGTRVILDFVGNYGKVSDEKSVDNQNLSASLDLLVTAGFFVNPIAVNYFRDPFQNLELKSTYSAGVGYDILRDDPLDWSVSLSGGYQSTKYVSVAPGAPTRKENGSVIAATKAEWEITDDIDWLFDYNAQVGVPDVSRAFHHARTSLSFDILGDVVDLALGIVWDRVESPEPDAGGNVPKRDDLRTNVTLGVEF